MVNCVFSLGSSYLLKNDKDIYCNVILLNQLYVYLLFVT